MLIARWAKSLGLRKDTGGGQCEEEGWAMELERKSKRDCKRIFYFGF